MPKRKATRTKAKKIIGIGLLPITGIISMLYSESVKKALEENKVIESLSEKLGVLMTSYWGLALIVLLILMIGAFITLWVEDWIDTRKERLKTLSKHKRALIYLEPDKSKVWTYTPTKKHNVEAWWRSGGGEQTVFVKFKSPIIESVVSVYSGNEDVTWSESFSGDEFAFIHINGLSNDNSFALICFDDKRLTSIRRQGLNEKKEATTLDKETSIDFFDALVDIDKIEPIKKNKFLFWKKNAKS